MKLIQGPARSGKTIALIQEASKLADQGHVAYIVCVTKERARYVFDLAQDLEVSIRFPISLRELMQSDRGGGAGITHLLYDDVDDMLRALARQKTQGRATAHAATWTTE